jgi:hypothetical protein
MVGVAEREGQRLFGLGFGVEEVEEGGSGFQA